MRFVWQLLAAVAVAFVGGQATAALGDSPWLMLVVGLLAAGATVYVYRWVVRRTEHREVTELAWRGSKAPLGRGTLIGLALFSLVILNIATNGGYAVHGFGSLAGALGVLGLMAAAAVTEEVLFRGVLFRIIEERLGTWLSLALTGVVFGFSHLLNPHANLWDAIAVALEAGGMLAAAYAATRNLWVPIGVHFGWNFAAGGLFSAEVSGNNTPQGLLDASTSGSRMLSGGEFGPEGSASAIGFCLVATVVFLWLAHRRGRVVPMRRSGKNTPADAGSTLTQ